MTKPKIFQHLNPILREQADFIIFANVNSPDGNPNNVYREQLWCKQISSQQFELCCIPFFAYNLALGDTVETDANYIIVNLVRPSGHFTFRIWFNEKTSEKEKCKILDDLDKLQCQTEWYSANLLGVDAETENKARLLSTILADLEGDDLIAYETGRQ